MLDFAAQALPIATKPYFNICQKRQTAQGLAHFFIFYTLAKALSIAAIASSISA